MRDFCFVKHIIGYVLTVLITVVSNINSETLMCINPSLSEICISESDFSLHSIPKDSNFNFKEEMGADISNFLYRVSTP